MQVRVGFLGLQIGEEFYRTAVWYFLLPVPGCPDLFAVGGDCPSETPLAWQRQADHESALVSQLMRKLTMRTFYLVRGTTLERLTQQRLDCAGSEEVVLAGQTFKAHVTLLAATGGSVQLLAEPQTGQAYLYFVPPPQAQL